MIQRRVVVGIAAALIPIGTTLGQPTDVRSFRTKVLDILRQKYPQLKAKAGKEDSLVEIEAGVIDLTNLHGKVRQLPADRQQAAIVDYVDRLVERVGQTAPERESWGEMSTLLRPRLVSLDMQKTAPTVLLRT